MLLKYRILGGLGALTLIGAAVFTSAGSGGAVPGAATSDTIGFVGQAFLAVPPTATKPGFGSLVAKQCNLKSDGETATSCTLTGSARLTLTGGTLTGSIRSSDGIITFNETFVNTSPTTGTGTGACREFDFDDRGSSTCTFTASFTTSPTGVANIVNDRGTIIVRDDPNQPGDPDSGGGTTTTVGSSTTAGT